MYIKYINRIRIAIPYVMAICGMGFVICARLRYETGVAAFGVGVAACLVATLGLVFEYLVRVWIERPGRTLAWYQFSLGGLLTLTTFVAVVCALSKIFGTLVILQLVVITVVTACIVEMLLLGSKKSSNLLEAGTFNERKIVTLTPHAVELARKIIRDRGFPLESALRIVLQDSNSLQIDIQYDLPLNDDRDWIDRSSGIIILIAKAIAHELEGFTIDAKDGQYVFDRQSAFIE
jgi:hypothetical protein